jgi:sugar phosphate isomerase/epimerase
VNFELLLDRDLGGVQHPPIVRERHADETPSFRLLPDGQGTGMTVSPLRGLLAAALTISLCLGAAGTAAASGKDRGGRGVDDHRISVQLWTFAEYIEFGNNTARTEEVFKRLREFGYRNVEPFSLGSMTAEQYRALLEKYRLRAPSRHVDVGTPSNPANIDQILADNATIGIKYFGSGGTPRLTTEAEWVAYAKYLNELGAKARRAGQHLMVHNHNWEFETKFGDKTAYDILLANTDKRNVAFQLDLYWAVFGGADPVALLRREGKRIQLFHVKDMRASDRRIEIVGRGVIDFPKIFAAGRNIRYYVVEHDPRFGDATFDPFEAAEVGFDYLDDVRFKHKRHGWGHHHGHGRGHDKGRGRGHERHHD